MQKVIIIVLFFSIIGTHEVITKILKKTKNYWKLYAPHSEELWPSAVEQFLFLILVDHWSTEISCWSLIHAVTTLQKTLKTNCWLLQVMAVAGGGKDGVEIQTARIVKYPTQRARLHTLRTSTPLDPVARQAATTNKSAGGQRDAAAPFGDRQSQFQTALMEAADRSVSLFPVLRIRTRIRTDPHSFWSARSGSALGIRIRTQEG
jgi:hypothetical protein